MKDYIKKYLEALKNNTNDIRKHTAIALGMTFGAIIAGVILGKTSDNRVEVIVVEENIEIKPEPVYSDSSEF